jgi:hypothetical protein
LGDEGVQAFVQFGGWGVGDGLYEAVGDKDTEDFLNLGGIVGTGVIEESVTIILCVVPEVVGIFLHVSVESYIRERFFTYQCNADGVLR